MVRYLQIIISLGILQLSHALLESIPLPAELQECYENRSYNVTPSPEMAMYIKNMCYRHYQLKQMAAGKVWGGEKLTKEGMNYINSLFRRLLREAEDVEKSKKDGGRQKRQTTRRFRQEVRSPGGFQAYANCIQRLQNEVSKLEWVLKNPN